MSRRRVIELLHLRTVGRQRAAAVSGDPLEDACQRNIEPGDRAVGKHQRPVVRLGERAAAGGDDDLPLRQQIAEHVALLLAEIGFTALGKRSRRPIAAPRFDAIVNVLDTPAEPAAQRPRHGRLAGAHEPDKINLVRVHARSDSSTEKNSGIRDRRGAGVVNRRRPAGAEGSDGEGHGQAVIVAGVHVAAAQAAGRHAREIRPRTPRSPRPSAGALRPGL